MMPLTKHESSSSPGSPLKRPPIQAPAAPSHHRTSSFFSSFRKDKSAEKSPQQQQDNAMQSNGHFTKTRTTPQTPPNQPQSPMNQLTQQQLQQYQAQQRQQPASNPPPSSSNLNAGSAPPPLHPEIRSVVSLTIAHAHKVYFSGPLVRRIERQSDGQKPTKDEGWTDVWAQLGGTTLSIWDMKAVEEASRKGQEVPPTYVNMTDAFVQVLGSVTVPATTTAPAKRYTDVLTLNTAGSNLLLFSCPSTSALVSWAAALRLSAWEKSRLEEIYTAHLIRITLHSPDVPTTLTKGKLEGWVRIRVAGQTDWKKMWMVISSATSDRPGSSNGYPGGNASSTVKKNRMSALFSRGNGTDNHSNHDNASDVPKKAMIGMYAGPKGKDRKTSLLTMTDITQAFAVYPERPELIPRSTLIKVEGCFGEEEAAHAMRAREGWLLIMPELEGGHNQAGEMLKWIVALHDAFELYGRPASWTWDPRDPTSLMFAYPVGPNKDLLFLDRELAETLDPRDDRTSAVRSNLLNILVEGMRGNPIPKPGGPAGKLGVKTSDGPPALPPIGEDEGQANTSGPLLPPLNFDGPSNASTIRPSNTAQHQQHQNRLSSITEMSVAIGSGSNNANGPASSTSYSTQQQNQTNPGGQLLDQALNSSPAPISPPLPAKEPGYFEHKSLPGRTSADLSRGTTAVSSTSNDTRSLVVGARRNSGAGSPTQSQNVSSPSLSSAASVPLPVSPGQASPSIYSNMTMPLQSPSFEQQQTQAKPQGPQRTTSVAASAYLPSPHSVMGHGVTNDDRSSIDSKPTSVNTLSSPFSPVDTPKHAFASIGSNSQTGTDRTMSNASSSKQSTRAESHKVAQSPPSVPSAGAISAADTAGNIADVDGALYYMRQLENEQTPGSVQPLRPHQHQRKISSQQQQQQQQQMNSAVRHRQIYGSSDSEENEEDRQDGSSPGPRTMAPASPTFDSPSGQQPNSPPVRRGTPMAFTGTTPPDRLSPTRQGLGRKPSGARAAPSTRATASGAHYGDHVLEGHDFSSSSNNNGNAFSSTSSAMQSSPNYPKSPDDETNLKQRMDEQENGSETEHLDALAALSYLAVDDREKEDESRYGSQHTPTYQQVQQQGSPSPASSPRTAPKPSTPTISSPDQENANGGATPFRSSFAPSKQAAERKAKVQAQQAEHHAATHKPGRVGKDKRKMKAAGSAADTAAWGESSDEEEEEEEEDDDDVDSDDEPPRPSNASVPSNRSQQQHGAQPNAYYQDPNGDSQSQGSHLRPPRTLPQIPGRLNGDQDSMYGSRKNLSDQVGPDSARRTYYGDDGTQIRTQNEHPMPGAARQTMWSQVLDPGNNVSIQQPDNSKFVQLESPSETMTKAFTPHGLLSAGLQDKQGRSAKKQEELARESGASLINVPNKPPPPQMGLLGAITAHERDRKREGGVGAALTEREREKRLAEERQRKFDEQQRQQLEQMQQGGSMYGYNPMMMGMNPMMGMSPMMTGNGMNPMMGGGLSPMMTGGGMNPMMTGYMPYNPQHMFAAQQAAAQVYQQAMMAFSAAGSQVGGDNNNGPGPGQMGMNPMMTGGMGYDPRMSMMSMGVMAPPMMSPMGMQMTGGMGFDPRFPPQQQGMMQMGGDQQLQNLVPPPPPGGAGGNFSSRGSSPARQGSPLAQGPLGNVPPSSRPGSPKR